MADVETPESTDLIEPVPEQVEAPVAEPAEPAELEVALEPVELEPVELEPSTPTPNSELAVIRNELTSALHEAHYQRRKRADAVQLLAYERLVRRSRVSGCIWLVAALALTAAGVWAWMQSVALYDLWQIGAAVAAALAIVALVSAIVTWAGPSRARQSLSLRQVKRLAPPEMLSEAWFHVAHEVGTPREYRRAFHGLV